MPAVAKSGIPGVTITDLWARDLSRKGRGNQWWVRVRNPNDGSFWSGTFPTEKKARKAGLDKLHQLAAGVDTASRADLATLAEDLCAQLARDKRSAGHIAEVRRVLTGAAQAGCKDLKNPRIAAKVNAYLDGLRDAHPKRKGGELSPATLNRFRTHFRAVANYALASGRIMRSPFMAMGRIATDDVRSPIFTLAECRKLVSDDALAHEYGVMAAVMLYSGMRCQEAAWLRWEHIAWDAKRLAIRLPDDADRTEAIRLALQWIDRNPGRPDVPTGIITTNPGGLTDAQRKAVEALAAKLKLAKRVKRNKSREAILQPELMAILNPIAKPAGYVFAETHRRWGALQHGRGLRSLCRVVRVGSWPTENSDDDVADDAMQGRHVHSLRHTHATLALAARMDVITLAEHLGHASLAMTQHYSRSVTVYREEVAHWPGRGELFLRSEAPKAAPSAPNPIVGVR